MAKNDENDLRFQNIALFHRGIFLRSFPTVRRWTSVTNDWKKVTFSLKARLAPRNCLTSFTALTDARPEVPWKPSSDNILGLKRWKNLDLSEREASAPECRWIDDIRCSTWNELCFSWWSKLRFISARRGPSAQWQSICGREIGNRDRPLFIYYFNLPMKAGSLM